MPHFIRTILQAWAERRRTRRRRANLHAGQRGPAVRLVSSRREPAGTTTATATATAATATATATAATATATATAAPDNAAGPAARGGTLRSRDEHARQDGRSAGAVGPRTSRVAWITAVGVVLAAGGGALIAGHARHLAATTASTPQSAANIRAANAYQSVLPGISFRVPAETGISASLHPGGVLLIASGLQAAPPVRVDLCSQLRSPTDTRLLPLRIGYRFDDVKRWVKRNEEANVQISLRNVLLVADRNNGADAMPEVQIEGMARGDFSDPLSEPLQLSWHARQGDARWLSDASFGQIEQGSSGQVALRQQGWLLWGANAALRIERRSNAMCPQAGELVVQIYRPAAPSATRAPAGQVAALVTAFPARGRAVNAYLAAGDYQVPAGAAGALEDQALFEQLQAQGLMRLNPSGAIDIAPRDLPQWQAAHASERAAELGNWKQVQPGPATQKLFKRLYYQADGAYVRQQIDIYNSERRLLAWRIKGPADLPLDWSATTADNAGNGNAPVIIATTSQMPVAASRLFASLPQGWQPWTRIARWPQATEIMGGRPNVRLTLNLPRAANGGEILHMLVAGRVAAAGINGASAQLTPACTGRACANSSDVQQITLTLQAGVRTIRLDLQPLDFNTPEDQKYRHLRVVGGHLIWQPLAQSDNVSARRNMPSAVQLQDRNGTTLWTDGAPSESATEAGLAPLLGISSEHANSVTGMLARLPAPAGTVNAVLTLDLPLQALSQRVLDCVAMHRGRWQDGRCTGSQPAPEGRHAGMVILDTETGDILAATGAGAGDVNAANWAEVRDFDRTSPARSPLRLPALQHDGGAHQSPGSTFKVISALGLELAAQNDQQIDALLSGMPLPAINRLAAQRGYGFQTDAASYPMNPRLAHITNYREQSLDRRAQEGRLGLAQALTYSLNTWFAWSSELSDRSLFGRPDGGAPDVQALDADALDSVRPIVAAARRLGFEQTLRLDGGLLPADFNWRTWDALQATPARIDPIHTRHELRQMAIGLRMQVTPLQMALASAAVGQGRVVAPRMLLSLDGASAGVPTAPPLGIRLDRIKAGMKGVVDVGTGAGAFRGASLAAVRAGLYGKTGTAPSGEDTATVWFTGWLEPGSLPGQRHRLAMAAFVSHSDATGGEHAAPVIAAILSTLAAQNGEQKGK
ncbi:MULTISPECIES: penicillin-binding transpeptidase domain-containing protein [unclassified Duganella]|uniref:penicillin-binding transpeptidase domain-containing protein n=1 Tax=unclassified Duganella TaxID=2636909 RepID=UPI0008849B87|nr:MULTISPECIES: penicillin-binding transpeptidase domain-containing protein [unclassified Duganella]SDF62926.1 Penicillin binding protein transpeptidase domain-containing protein [Duganella sp. OV458]SDI65508.1 Penicillin binding protein transpeptidase domain-containing protein [Duganella sp. OV510]